MEQRVSSQHATTNVVQEDDNRSFRLSYHFVSYAHLLLKIRIQDLIRGIYQLFRTLKMVREGPELAERRRNANGISKKWRITRRN